jgi:hypothetical protein
VSTDVTTPPVTPECFRCRLLVPRPVALEVSSLPSPRGVAQVNHYALCLPCMRELFAWMQDRSSTTEGASR